MRISSEGGGGQLRQVFFFFLILKRREDHRKRGCVGRKRSDWVWAQDPSLKEDGNAWHVSTTLATLTAAAGNDWDADDDDDFCCRRR